MKKILYSAAALALAFFAASCQQENLEPVVSGNTVTYTVQVADAVATRALGDDITAVDELVYEVYRTKEPATTSFTDVDHLLYHKTADVKNGVATIEIEFVNDQNFTVLFWAHTKDNGVYNVENLTNVTITSPDVANNVNAQAFVGRDFVRDCVSEKSGKVTLVRPVSQLNIATTPESLVFEAEAGETGSRVVLEGSSVKVTGLATSYNIATLSAFGAAATEYTYTETAVPADVLTVNGKDYTYVAMNYVGFAPEMGTSDVTVSYVINTSEGNIDNEILNVPVKPNYRTNIIGNLITSKTDYTITLEDTWGKDNYTVDLLEEVPSVIDLGDGNTVIIPNLSADHGVLVKGEGVLELDGTTLKSSAGAALEFAENANVTLIIKNNVSLTGAADGIYVPENATLTIVASGTPIVKSGVTENNLTAVGNAGSGIDGSVVIDGLSHITAKGNGDHAYGIGGSAANVVIKNSTVDYVCGGHIQPLCINDPKYGKSEPEGGAAIGGAFVRIEGSVVTKADGGSKAAAIGESYWQSTEVEIINSTIVESNGGNASAGIGGSRYAGEEKHNVSVKIQNSNVTATGGQFGAGIGSGYDTHCNGQSYEAVNYIEIDATSIINAKGGKYAAGIGTGFHAAHLTGNIAAGAQVTAVAGDENFYKDAYTTAQNIGYGVVDPAREFSGKNANVTFTVAGEVVEYPLPYVVNGNDVMIYTAAGLRWVADVVNTTTPYTQTFFDDKTVYLMNDIDLNNEEWIPIGDDRSQRTEFHGVFDGQGYTVKNVKITKKTDRDDENKSSYGLFGNLKGTVKNLTVENVSISGAPKFIGALVGRINDGLIENCHVKNSTVTCNNWTIGGLVGQLNNGKISGCSVEGTTVTGYGAVAAIAGIALNKGERTIENCSVKNCTIAQNGYFGGNYDKMFGAIVGALYSGELTVNLNNCSVESTTIKGESSDVLCGYVSEGDKLLVNGYEHLSSGLGYDSTSKTYAISSAEGLVSMSQIAIKGSEKVILTADIDLTDVEFNGLSAFNSEASNIFDGNGHKVSNWTNEKGASDMAFIRNWVGTIKNVTIENATLKTSGRSAVLAANAYVNIDNCHVVNSHIVDSYWACGVIAGLYNSGSITNCSVDRCSVKSNGGVGGIVGVINESAGERKIENCTVKNSTVNNTGAYGETYSGALVAGMFNAAGATYKFINCTLENNTKEGKYVGDLFYSAEGNSVFVDGVQQ